MMRVNDLFKMSKTQILGKPQHEYFTTADRACFRSVQYSVDIRPNEGIDLPGPAAWWPDNYDFVYWG